MSKRKIDFLERSHLLDVIIGFMVILTVCFLARAIWGLNHPYLYSESRLSNYIEDGEYDRLLYGYKADYEPDKNYTKDKEECYAAAEYYWHASIYVAAEACQDTENAEIELELMNASYERMGQYQKYAEDMLDYLKK